MRFQFPWKVKDFFFPPYIIHQEKENYCDFIFLFKHNLQEPVQRYEEPFWATADETGRDLQEMYGCLLSLLILHKPISDSHAGMLPG